MFIRKQDEEVKIYREKFFPFYRYCYVVRFTIFFFFSLCFLLTYISGYYVLLWAFSLRIKMVPVELLYLPLYPQKIVCIQCPFGCNGFWIPFYPHFAACSSHNLYHHWESGTRDKLVQKFWPFLFTLKQNVSAVASTWIALWSTFNPFYVHQLFSFFFSLVGPTKTPLSISISFICQTSNIRRKKIQNFPMNHFGQWTCLMCKKGLTWIMNLNNYSKKYLNSVTSGHVYQNIDEK